MTNGSYTEIFQVGLYPTLLGALAWVFHLWAKRRNPDLRHKRIFGGASFVLRWVVLPISTVITFVGLFGMTLGL